MLLWDFLKTIFGLKDKTRKEKILTLNQYFYPHPNTNSFSIILLGKFDQKCSFSKIDFKLKVFI